MNEQQSKHKCETTLSKLIKVLISQESWRKGAMQGARQFVEGIGVKGHGGVDQQRPVTSLKTRPEREVAWNLPRQLHGALPDRVGRVTGSWRYVWLLSRCTCEISLLRVLENSRKSWSSRSNRDESARSQIFLPFSLLLEARAVGKG